MSIIENGKKIAGNYKIQLAPEASTENAGVIKIATDQDIQDGTSEKLAVTPKQLNSYVSKDDISEVAKTGSYNDLIDIPEQYSLPIASTVELGGVKVDGDTINIDESGIISVGRSGSSGGAFELFDTKLSDHILSYEETKGWALQGTYVYSTAIAGERYGYPDFINKCIEEKETGVATQVTLGDSTVTMYINSNGHQFYDIVDKEKVDSFFATTGLAWFYGVDTENERVFLPRNNFFDQATGDIAEVGEGVDAGLPNITGGFQGDLLKPVGAFYGNGTVSGNATAGSERSNDTQFKFDASHSNPIYGNSGTVQPPAVKKLLYICVGNTVSDTSWIDVVTQVQEGVKDLEDKTQEGLDRLNTTTNNSIANINATAKSYDNLTYRNITNCLLEVPQRIKYDLTDGTLTIKAGTVVIVPYGTEDLSATYPVGSTFINENFKVVDTQFTDGKFFVWVELVNDGVRSLLGYTSATGYRILHIDFDNSEATPYFGSGIRGESGTSATSSGTYCDYYNTSTNLMYFANDTTTLEQKTLSLPFAIYNVNTDTITQVFNGIGYIGSTIWVDKGVKGLSVNGRNGDLTLNNIETKTSELSLATITKDYGDTELWLSLNNSKASYMTTKSWQYDSNQNGFILNDDFNSPRYGIAVIGSFKASGTISNFNPKQPIRLVDYNEFEKIITIVDTYVNGTSGYIIYSNKYCEQWGRSSKTEGLVTITLLKSFKDTNYSVIVAGLYASGSTANGWDYVRNVTTTSFSIYQQNAGCMWRACGYIS